MNALSSEPEGSKPRRLRWWPAWCVLGVTSVVLAYVRWAGDQPFQARNLQTAKVVAGGIGALALWWLLFSRATWRVRLAGVALVLAGCGLLGSLVRIRGVSGDLVPVLEWRWARRTPPAQQVSSALVRFPESVSAPPGGVDDFPQFQGPHRDGVLKGPALATDWTKQAPELVWKQPVGAAWSGFAVVGQRAITQEQRGEEELVTCYDLQTGRRLWEHADPSRYATTIAGEGPRCTPTVSGERVFTLGANGLVNCLEVNTGKALWQRDLRKEAGVSVPGWGFASSPLVLGDLVLASAGGQDQRSLLAFGAADGRLAWTGGTRSASYSSPAVLELGGMPQIVMFNSRQITAHDPANGRVLWEYPWGIGQPHVALPVVVGTNQVVFSSGYGVGAEKLEVARGPDGAWSARQLWKSIRLKSKFANFFHRDGFLYGLDDGILVCVDAKDGQLRWKEGRYGHGQMLWVRDVLVVMAESGEVILLQPTPDAPRECSRYRVFSGKTWNPPALAGTWLLVRNDLEAAAVRLPLRQP